MTNGITLGIVKNFQILIVKINDLQEVLLYTIRVLLWPMYVRNHSYSHLF